LDYKCSELLNITPFSSQSRNEDDEREEPDEDHHGCDGVTGVDPVVHALPGDHNKPAKEGKGVSRNRVRYRSSTDLLNDRPTYSLNIRVAGLSTQKNK